MYKKAASIILVSLFLNSCGFKVSSQGANSGVPGTIISGVISPFVGLIASSDQHHFLNHIFSSANAVPCTDPTYAKLYRIESDGSINDSNLLSSQLIGSDARYSFNTNELGLNNKNKNVEFIIKAEGCNGETFKRPVTSFDNLQNIDAKTTVVAEVINANNIISNKLNQVERKEVELLLKSVSGSNTTTALNSLTSNATNVAMFTQIFGTNPSAIQNARPEVKLVSPQLVLNELQVSTFSLQTFHVDPSYSFAYRWKVDGVVKSSSATLNYIPASNDQGTHQIDLYVGKDDGSGNIDLTKPYYTKTSTVTVGNNILPTSPDFSISPSTPSPTNLSSMDILIDTGSSISNCDSFSSLAYSLTPTPPGPMAFNITCSTNGLQNQNIDIYGADGSRVIYLWAKDSDGNISAATTQNFILDTTPPVVIFAPSLTHFMGGAAYNFSVSMSDATSSISDVVVQVSSDNGSTFSDIATYANSINTFSYTFPSSNSSTFKLRLKTKDAVLNETTTTSVSMTVDSIAPSPLSISRTSAAISNSRNVGLSVTCTADDIKILFSESSTTPSFGDAAWESCLASKTFQVSTGDGLKTIYAFTRDLAGNISNSSSQTMTLDTTPPTLSLTSFNSGTLKAGSSYNITWSLSDLHMAANPVLLEYTIDGATYNTIASSLSNSGTYTWTVPSQDLNTLKIKISAIDSLSNTSSMVSSSNLIVDLNPPVASALSATGGITSTGNRNVLLNFSSNDSQTDITHFCLKHADSVAPLVADTCWVSSSSLGLPSSKNFTVSNYSYQIAILQGDYTIKVWYKDIYDHISANTGTLNSDAYTITYNPDPAPTLTNITAASSDTPTSPLILSDTTVTIGNDLFIKWNISDNAAISSGAISLYYSTNDTNYTLIANGLNNNANSSCSIGAGESGCFRWAASSPTSAYYRIKLVVSDSINQTVYDLSNPINTGNVKFLSGNTSLGIGGSASNAIFFNYGEDAYNDFSDNQSLAVTKTGYVFFKYLNRGIVYISPNDGLVRDLVLNTGTSTGDNGSAFSATLNSAKRIDLDPNENLIVWDYNRIRKIDLSTNPWTITTLAGGGADTTSGADALSASLPLPTAGGALDPMTIFPNGNIYFEKGKELWYLDASDSKIKHYLTLTGLGTDTLTTWKASYDNSACPGAQISVAYNKSTSSITKIMRRMSGSAGASCGATSNTPYYNTNFNLGTGVAEAPHPPQTVWSATKFTGKDGKIYVLNQGRSSILRYNPSTNIFDRIAGNNSNGRCIDGTLATDCPIVAMSAFVNEFGKIYFVDLGVIRTVDSDGKVQTIAGQPRNFGAGFNPLSARYSQISFFEVNNDDIYVSNDLENQIMKFSLAGGNLTKVAGNSVKGTPANGSNANSSPIPSIGWAKSSGMILDPTNNRLYRYFEQKKLAYINLNTGNWVVQLSSGVQDLTSTTFSYLGFTPDGKLLINTNTPDGLGGALSVLKVVEPNSTVTHIYGSNPNQGMGTGTICNNEIGTNCILPSNYQYNSNQLKYPYDHDTNEWLIASRNKNVISRLPVLGGTVNLYETLTFNMNSFDFYRDGSSNEFIFYCSTGGALYKRNVATNIETLLPLPTTTMKCSGMSLYYHQARNSLIFSYRQNSLDGIAEYINP